ncbi:hypothetical protein ACLOJK_010914 [Asimina triloba]
MAEEPGFGHMAPHMPSSEIASQYLHLHRRIASHRIMPPDWSCPLGRTGSPLGNRTAVLRLFYASTWPLLRW